MTTRQPADRLLSIDEAAAFLGLSVQTLYSWRYRGIGPKSYRVGGRAKYRLSELERWLQEQAIVPGVTIR